jgi:hypothetical protein
MYHDEMPPRVPLSMQKEFKQIKNMVIAEAMGLGGIEPDFGIEPELTEPHIDEDIAQAEDAPDMDDGPAKQSSPDLFMATTRLFKQLGRIFEQQQQQLGAQMGHIDRKRMRALREKKIAQGHARGDHEPKQGGIYGS